jgi:hypothetical protein
MKVEKDIIMQIAETNLETQIAFRNFNFFYGKYHALRNINLDIANARSPPSSARRAVASRPCCAP